MTNPTQSETLLREARNICAKVFDDKASALASRPLVNSAAVELARDQADNFRRGKNDDCEQMRIALTALQSIPEPLLDEGLVSVRIDPATAQTLMDWNVLHTTDAGWVIDLDIWRSALSIPRLEAGSHDALVRDLRRHAFDDCGGIPPRTHISIQAADEIERLRAIPRLEAGRVTEAMLEAGFKALGVPLKYANAETLRRAYLAMSSASAPDGLPLVERMREALVEARRRFRKLLSAAMADGRPTGEITFCIEQIDAALTELEEKSDG